VASKGRTVLVVEDSPVQSLAITKLLEETGLHVLSAPNGRIGVAMATEHVPDVIVLDIEMPEMDGFEVCKHLKKEPKTAQIPIVMLTAHDQPPMLIQGMELGAIDFIPKDVFSDQVLVETLRQLNILEPPPAKRGHNAKN